MNILLTSVGRRSYIVEYFKEALTSYGKVIASNSVYTSAMCKADEYYITPIIYDESYIPCILDICKKENITALLSLFDIDLPILAKNKDSFNEIGVKFIGPSYETAMTGNDKLKTKNFFISCGLSSPETYIDLELVIRLLSNNEINFPLVIKPRWGMGSIGIYIAKNIDELRVFYKKCLSDVFESYLKFESAADKETAVLIQSFVNGQEYGIDIYKDLTGRYVTSVVKKKLAMRSGETDIGETVELDQFKSFIEAVTENLQFTGLLSVDCFLGNEGVYGIEINPRISGHYPFSHLAGVRYPNQLIDWLNGKPTNISYFQVGIGVRGCKELTPTLLKIF